jgi:hypothetical protein
MYNIVCTIKRLGGDIADIDGEKMMVEEKPVLK